MSMKYILLLSLHLLCNQLPSKQLLEAKNKRYKGFGSLDSPALCSANLAPTRSECFKNLSAQFWTHVFCGQPGQ